MREVIAGAFSGLLMASVTVALGPIMLFYLAKEPSPFFRALLRKIPPIYMTMGLVVLAYPTWTVMGAVGGVLYRISATEAPGGGLGSPNLLFSLARRVAGSTIAPPAALLLRLFPSWTAWLLQQL